MAKAKKKSGRTKKELTPKKNWGKIQSMREVVTNQMERLGLTPYAVARDAQSAGGKLTEQAVRNFVKGKSAMTSDKLAAVFVVLGLEVRPKR